MIYVKSARHCAGSLLIDLPLMSQKRRAARGDVVLSSTAPLATLVASDYAHI